MPRPVQMAEKGIVGIGGHDEARAVENGVVCSPPRPLDVGAAQAEDGPDKIERDHAGSPRVIVDRGAGSRR